MLQVKDRDMNPPDDDYRCQICTKWDEQGVEIALSTEPFTTVFACQPCAKEESDAILDNMFICADCKEVLDNENGEVDEIGLRVCWDCINKRDEMDEREQSI